MNRKVLTSLLIIGMVLAAMTGGTLAWFTDTDSITENTFTAGTLLIEADETYNITEPIDLTKVNPGDCIEKEITVKVTGTKKAFLRARITETWGLMYEVDGDGYIVKNPDGTPKELPAAPVETLYYERNAPMINWTGWNSANWDQLTVDGVVYFFYKGILDPEGLDEIIVMTELCLATGAGNMYQGAQYKLEITFDAIQTTYDAENSWGVSYNPGTSTWTLHP